MKVTLTLSDGKAHALSQELLAQSIRLREEADRALLPGDSQQRRNRADLLSEVAGIIAYELATQED